VSCRRVSSRAMIYQPLSNANMFHNIQKVFFLSHCMNVSDGKMQFVIALVENTHV